MHTSPHARVGLCMSPEGTIGFSPWRQPRVPLYDEEQRAPQGRHLKDYVERPFGCEDRRTVPDI